MVITMMKMKSKILQEDQDIEGDEDHEDVEARGHQVDGSRVPVQSLKTKKKCEKKSLQKFCCNRNKVISS